MKNSRIACLAAALFVLELAIRLSIFDGTALFLHGDGQDYLKLANQIAASHDVFDEWRLPGYSLFAWTVNGFQAIDISRDFAKFIVAQNVVSSLSSVLFFYLCTIFTRKPWLSFLTSFVVFLHASWMIYDGTFLTETLSIFLLLLHALSLCALANQPGSYIRLIAVFWVLVLLILVKPTYVFLPVLTLLTVGIFLGKEFLRTLGMLSLAMTALIFGMLHLFSAENMKRHGFYGVTEVGNVNLFMRPVTLNLDGESLKPGSIEKLPPDIRELSELFQTMRNDGVIVGLYSRVDAYLLEHRPDLREHGYTRLDDWGRYVIRTQPTAFVTGSLIEMESISDSYDLSMINVDNLRRRWFTPALQHIQKLLSIFSFHLTWILVFNGLSLVGYFVVSLRGKKSAASLKKGILLAYLWLLTVYTVGFSAFGSFSIGSRAKVPVEPLAFLHFAICLFYIGSLGYARLSRKLSE